MSSRNRLGVPYYLTSTILPNRLARYHLRLHHFLSPGKVEGKRPRGRSPRRWSDQVKSLTGFPITEAIKKAEDRTGWKAVVKIATNELESGHDLQQ
ncbi:jg931 [Pararge aegeria aegeria]|uniref:Jg931 protein n=1 Tax=Pararge aegeria aegeria TaxID=348720 RepID=A0A8S4R976_9NEOP|nr:jg931 [Pararge aegeria aegeria]